MKLQWLLLLLLLVLVLHQGFPGTRSEPPIASEWHPIKDASYDLHVQTTGKFAVEEYNKGKKALLTFKRVISGEFQLESGVKYRLQVETATEGGEIKNYRVMVWKKPCQGSWVLISFNPAPAL